MTNPGPRSGDLEGGEAPLALRTSNGRIDVAGTRSGRIDLRTSNGHITIGEAP